MVSKPPKIDPSSNRNKSLLYSSFVSSKSSQDQVHLNSPDRDYSIKISDEDLLLACEGRTARKGSRVDQVGKLERIHGSPPVPFQRKGKLHDSLNELRQRIQESKFESPESTESIHPFIQSSIPLSPSLKGLLLPSREPSKRKKKRKKERNEVSLSAESNDFKSRETPSTSPSLPIGFQILKECSDSKKVEKKDEKEQKEKRKKAGKKEEKREERRRKKKKIIDQSNPSSFLGSSSDFSEGQVGQSRKKRRKK